MGLARVDPGVNMPSDINVIIEIPAHSEPIKYEVNKDTGALFVDRFMSTCMHYPCDYGYIPRTLSEDGDPVDVLVITPIPVNRGCVIRSRPVGMLKMEDEAGPDEKIIAVPIEKLTNLYDHVQKPSDLPNLLLAQIEHFFAHYKDLETNKWVKLQGWVGPDAAKKVIKTSVERFNATVDHTGF